MTRMSKYEKYRRDIKLQAEDEWWADVIEKNQLADEVRALKQRVDALYDVVSAHALDGLSKMVFEESVYRE